jgi:Zn-dependent protease
MTHPLRVFYTLNILLFIFNLIPVHPLDGGKVLGWLLGAKYQHIDDLLARWGFVIILVLMFSNALAIVLGPFYTWGSQVLDAVTVR